MKIVHTAKQHAAGAAMPGFNADAVLLHGSHGTQPLHIRLNDASDASRKPLLEAHDVRKSYAGPAGRQEILRGVSLSVMPGEFVSIVGRSGSGKSTLLYVLSTLIRPDSGSVVIGGRDVSRASESDLNHVRRHDISMIFQAHHLMPYLSALENVLLPCVRGLKSVSPEQREKALDCLRAVGLAHKAQSLPRALSGGEQQRVAIARGLVSGARLLFADEPTGSLDEETGNSIMDLLGMLNGQGLAIVMVTHNADYAALSGRTLTMHEGALE